MIPELKVSDAFRMQDVKRWHLVEVSRPQSDAEHTAGVMILALHTWERLIEQGAVKFESSCKKNSMTLNLILYVLTHDFPEIVYGDIPTPTKRLLGIKDLQMDVEFWGTRKSLNAPVIPALEVITDILQFCDLLEAVVYYHRFGKTTKTHFGYVKEGMTKRLAAIIMSLVKTYGSSIWAQVASEALDEFDFYYDWARV